MTLEHVKAEALKLSDEDQARLVDELLARVHGHLDPEIAQAWYDEAERRMAEFGRGEVKGIPADEVFRKLRERLG